MRSELSSWLAWEKGWTLASVEVGVREQVWEETGFVVAVNSQPESRLGSRRERRTLGGRVAEQVGEDHRPPSDSERKGDISDGILAATVLEYSPESYQNILKQAPFQCTCIVQRYAWLVA